MSDPDRLLIVDDDRLYREGIRRLFKKAGYDVLTAASAAECLEMAARRQPSLIVLDVVLPDGDGRQVCRRIKQDSKCRDIYVVLVSAIRVTDAEQAEGFDAGADGYLIKPIGNAVLLALVKNFLRFRKNEISLRQEIHSKIQSEQEWKSTFNAIHDWIALVDLDRRILRSNRAGEQLLGLPHDRIIGATCCDLLHGPEHDESECLVNRMLEAGVRTSRVFYFKNRSAWFHITVDPLRNADGNIIYAVHIVRDISYQKRMEIDLAKAKKTESIAILSGGIAHDYNNLIAVMMGNASLMDDEIPAHHPAREYLDEIEIACRQAKELTHKFLTLSEAEHPQRKIGLITPVVLEAAEREINGRIVQMHTEIDSDLWLVNCDPKGIRLVVGHIVRNAVEAMHGGGELWVEIRNTTIGSNPPAWAAVPAGRYVLIAIQDTGVGIAEQHIEQIFDPYFSTKQRGAEKGMGLGLATVFAIIDKHDGYVGAVPGMARGARFEIFLPVVEAEPVREADIAHAWKEGLPFVLVLEDEKSLQRVYKSMLEGLGCACFFVQSGESAIMAYHTAASIGKRFDLMVLDQCVKGGLSGTETLSIIKQDNERAKAVLVTGSRSGPVISDPRKFGFLDRLLKPFDMVDLQQILDSALSRS